MLTTFSAPQSIITPLYNGERWIDQCFDSVLAQNFGETLELSVYDDSSTVSMKSFDAGNGFASFARQLS